MVETVTANYGWTKPEVTHSASTWGGFLNNDLDSIDALVFANQQGIVPIGAVTMFAGAAAPANWLLCNGQVLSTAAPYDKLFAVLGYAFGGGGVSFTLPNLQQRFPLGVGPSNAFATTGGAATVTLDTTMIPAHAHPVTQTPHTHGLTQHTHPINGGLTHTHTVNAVFGGGSEIQSGSGWGQHNIQSSGSGSVVTDSSAAMNVSSVTANITGNATGTTGSGVSHNNMPPFIAINFIIRYV